MNNQQTNFYSSIANYYHELFPFNPAQLQFVERNLGGLAGKNILDIGCATGELAFQLARAGANVTGIDINGDLLQRAKAEKKHKRLTFLNGDMLKLEEAFQSGQFDAVLCFGNTLVHLSAETLVAKVFSGVRSVLKPGGIFLLQILNYDYIVSGKVTRLPVIETENIKFIRRYQFGDNLPLIVFQTWLQLKTEEEEIKNETQLLALKSERLRRLLEEAGFNRVKLFANFREDDFGGPHLPLVAAAEIHL